MSSAPQATHVDPHILQQLTSNVQVTLNLGQNIIMTTEDKVRLAVTQHLSAMEQRNGWVAPVGILITIFAAFVTADFKQAILSPAQWHAVFLVTGVITFAWCIRAIYRAIRAPSVDEFVVALTIKKADTPAAQSATPSA
jgi:hypothetical protein